MIEKQLIAIYQDGRIEKKKIDTVPELDDLKEIVDGWIEIIPYFDTYEGNPCIAFCDEEGKIKGKLYNILANQFWMKSDGGLASGSDILVGSIAIVTGPKKFLREM
jgi:hypothetical protein